MMMEMMGLHIPGAAFVPPNTPLRQALTREAVHRLDAITKKGNDYRPMAQVVDEKAIVNAIVGLLATGGSTNHAIHLPAMARAAGIIIDWEDFDELSGVVPLMSRVYPNGSGDVNHFHAAGGMAWIVRELLGAGLAHADVLTVAEGGMEAYANEPTLDGRGAGLDTDIPADSGDDTMLRPVAAPFQADGGMRLVSGNLGRATFKTSAVDEERWTIEAPVPGVRYAGSRLAGLQGGRARPRCRRRRALPGSARQWHARAAQADPAAGRAAGSRLQGGAGHRWPHVGRIGQSSRPPSTSRLRRWPLQMAAGVIAYLRDGDIVRLCAEEGTLSTTADLSGREPAPAPASGEGHGPRTVRDVPGECQRRRTGRLLDAGHGRALRAPT